MPTYRIFRMKEQARLSVRAAPHTIGETDVTSTDYVEAESIESDNAYEAWELLRATEQPLQVGDILESELGSIKICKYIGFDDAKWILPEVKTAPDAVVAEAASPTADAAVAKL